MLSCTLPSSEVWCGFGVEMDTAQEERGTRLVLQPAVLLPPHPTPSSLLLKELCNLLASGLAWPGPGLCSYFADINEHHNSNSYQRTVEETDYCVRVICFSCQLCLYALEGLQKPPWVQLLLFFFFLLSLLVQICFCPSLRSFCVILLEWKYRSCTKPILLSLKPKAYNKDGRELFMSALCERGSSCL